ncbi:unnamed protein product [Diabrotica balteata]|uniref:Uncharacterized protein n=1 Tax=Diabrotica balteata TaxID=107213 RepID=A0A9N9T3D8_DIABA|nr:unnamed protein product [Diabrotica balteata]
MWFNQMEVKQEFNEDEDTCKIETYDLLVSFKNEIKGELNSDKAHNTFDDLGLNQFSVKTEIKDENILLPVEEKQTNEKVKYIIIIIYLPSVKCIIHLSN